MSVRNCVRLGSAWTFTITLLTLAIAMMTSKPVAAILCSVPSAGHADIQDAVDDSGCDAISLGSATFYETVRITRSLAIYGMGPDDSVVNGSAADSVFVIGSNSSVSVTVTLDGLTIESGSASSGGGINKVNASLTLTNTVLRGNVVSGSGGAIFNGSGSLMVQNSRVESNDAGTGGGVFVNAGAVTMTGVIFSENSAQGHGGALYISAGATAILTNTTTFSNTAQVDGGGLFNHGVTTIYSSAFIGNDASSFSGGGIRNEAEMAIINSTISGNRDNWVHGSGISNVDGSLLLVNCTVTGNLGAAGLMNVGGTVRAKSSIISGNVNSDCSGTVESDGFNVIGPLCSGFNPGSGDLVNVSASLGDLAGTPAAHPLLIGPGVHSGDSAGCSDHFGNPLLTDQQGHTRTGPCDSGASAYQGAFYQIFLPSNFKNACSDYLDRFSDASSGWPIGESAYVAYGYTAGEYQVFSKIPGYVYLFNYPSCDRGYYRVETDVRWEGAPGNGYGILFGIQGDYERYYLFDVNTDYQMYRLLYQGPGGWETIISPTSSGVIQPGGGSNHLSVTRYRGKEIPGMPGTFLAWIKIEVNGLELATLEDTRGPSADGLAGVGIVSSRYGSGYPSDARFDNYQVTSLPNTSSSEMSRAVDEPAFNPASRKVRDAAFAAPGLPPWQAWPDTAR